MELNELIKLPEPTLQFAHSQSVEDPRDGLTLFGPLDRGRPHGVRAGVIGTAKGVRIYQDWVKKISSPILDLDAEGVLKENRPLFPGFKAAFGIEWDSDPFQTVIIPEGEIEKYVYLDDAHQRVFKTVDVYAQRIINALSSEDQTPDIWFVVIPEIIYKNCRPLSTIKKELQVEADVTISARRAKGANVSPFLFAEEEQDAIPYRFELNFHNQLKAKLLEKRALTQVLRETTLAPGEFLNQFGYPTRRVDDPSTIAWNISTAVYYKVGGRPWKLNNIRDGVCYIGLVFKQDETHADVRQACCAAQMFLDSGDGVVFKGNVGPWYSPKNGTYHLSEVAAKALIGKAVDSYREKFGEPPRELFIHGKTTYDANEWRGFNSGIDAGKTNVVGIKIYGENHFKLFRKETRPVLRGLAYLQGDWISHLWTKGFTPRLRTYPGRAVPKPLFVQICRGQANMTQVLTDIFALTKLNYNACIFADGQPVTLKFANAVGEILTAGPLKDYPPLPFKHYI